ncbi:DNA-3-methyladenine glycosylase I [Candidatus Nitrosarchaeum limnium]|jgi:DNA-3-methyladenine glycosylase I|uniref:DNA-3-methyladenine glycosylase I n=1 Tax=Candidatus Nitrosarchaeum limnium BG20 TaxID=859192 RepID=S2EJ15_9ARCH|nr:DNA-3-methyladenine glycosylase I [Candidatus Nitrosarchaeum limnium]EPA04717.1 DNA-3-methyladenine glycosylase I [Candidatus Nitrosarchaeum limnium BG20]
MKTRCEWAKDDLNIEYHDNEWGKPQHDDRKLFEFLILEGAQAGLTWTTILKRREGYRKAFSDFDPDKVSKYTAQHIENLLNNSEIIRNKLKINSAINNAKLFIKIQKEFGSFDKYIWGFVNHTTITNNFKRLSDIPASTDISKKMSDDLKKYGFNFVGPTICYAFMQAVGMVNDHTSDCFLKKSNTF